MFQVVGCLIVIANLIVETAYLFKTKFATVTYLGCYLTTYTLKLLIPLIIVLVNLKTYVIGKFPKEYKDELDI